MKFGGNMKQTSLMNYFFLDFPNFRMTAHQKNTYYVSPKVPKMFALISFTERCEERRGNICCSYVCILWKYTENVVLT